jgi:hypothetical protein
MMGIVTDVSEEHTASICGVEERGIPVNICQAAWRLAPLAPYPTHLTSWSEQDYDHSVDPGSLNKRHGEGCHGFTDG